MSEPKQVIVVRADLNMRRGKEAAQVAHASMKWLAKYALQYALLSDLKLTLLALLTGFKPKLKKPEKEWLTGAFAKVVVSVDSEAELLEIEQKALQAGVRCESITDSGRTEFHGKPTLTCIALGPDYPEVIDPITRHLKLR
jgi:PTH2 family peptidyl-tRNA hydrolase